MSLEILSKLKFSINQSDFKSIRDLINSAAKSIVEEVSLDFFLIEELLKNIMSLSERIVTEIHDSIILDTLQEALKLMHSITKLKLIKGFSIINHDSFCRLIDFLRQNKSNPKLDQNLVLYILLSSSENFEPSFLENYSEKLLSALNSISDINTGQIVNQIITNFNKVAIEIRLKKLKNLQEEFKSFKKNPKDCLELLREDLDFISITLYKNKNFGKIFRDLFRQYSLFDIFTKIFVLLSEILIKTTGKGMEEVRYYLKNIQIILIILVENSIEFNEEFLKNQMFETFNDLFSSDVLIEYLFYAETTHLHRYITIFMCFCRTIYHRRSTITHIPADSFKIYKNPQNALNRLFLLNKHSGLEDISIFRMYHHALTYFQHCFNESIFDSSHKFSILMPNDSFFLLNFSEISDTFKDNSEIVSREIINEFGETETESIHKLKIAGVGYTIIRALVDILNFMKVGMDNFESEIKIEMFKSWIVFYKCIVYYGFTVEKILCLSLLEKYCLVRIIKDWLKQEKDLIRFLRNLLNQNESLEKSSMQDRLYKRIAVFLETLR